MLARDSENCCLNTMDKADMKITLKVRFFTLHWFKIEECGELLAFFTT